MYRRKHWFLRCFAHILNIIVKDVLNELKAGIKYDAEKIIDNINEKQSISAISAIQKIRTLVLYIQESPQRKKIWNRSCVSDSARFIPYDVPNRWNWTTKGMSKKRGGNRKRTSPDTQDTTLSDQEKKR
jgi:hypothetical protein